MNQLTFEELPSFIENFCDNLEIIEDVFTVTGYDTNIDLLTNRKPATYLPVFRELKNHTKIIHSTKTGITFSSKNYGCERLYDKISENQFQEIAVDDENENRLRIEQSVKKFPSGPRIIRKLRDFTIPRKFTDIMVKHQTLFNSISKQSLVKLRDVALPRGMDLERFALIRFINDEGMEGYKTLLDQQKIEGFLNTRQVKAKALKAEEIWSSYVSSLNYLDLEDLLDEVVRKANQKFEETKR